MDNGRERQFGLRKGSTMLRSTMLRSIVLVAALCALSPLLSQAASYGRGEADRAWVQQAPQRHYPGKQGRQHESDRGDGDRRGALTPDERRELHRDLQRANREIYRKGKDRPNR